MSKSLFGYSGSTSAGRAFDLCILDEMEREKKETDDKLEQEKESDAGRLTRETGGRKASNS